MTGNFTCRLAFLATLCLPWIARGGEDDMPAPNYRRFASERALPDTMNRGYRLYVPDLPERQLAPLVVYLHGSGAKGSDLERPTHEPLPQLLASEGFQRCRPCFVLVPQCRDGNDGDDIPRNWVQWQRTADAQPADWQTSDDRPTDQLQSAIAALEDVLTKRQVDPQRVYLIGVSMGGSGAWWWASHSPKRFAAVLPICGLSEVRRAQELVKTPVWALHGAQDAVVPIERTRTMVEALRQQRAPIEFTEYEGAGHDIAGQVARDRDVWEWLFTQRLTEDPK